MAKTDSSPIRTARLKGDDGLSSFKVTDNGASVVFTISQCGVVSTTVEFTKTRLHPATAAAFGQLVTRMRGTEIEQEADEE